MLHLQPSIHLQKIEIHIRVSNKLHRTRRLIVHSFGQRTTLLTHLLASSFIKKRRRRLLNHLLMTALNRALPLTQINHIAIAIGHHLNFNMAGLLNIFLNKDARITKARTRLISGTLKTIPTVRIIPSHAHAFTTATSRSLKHHRVTNSRANLNRMVSIANHIRVTRNTVNPRLFSNQLRGNFIPHRLNSFFTRANKDNPRLI